MKRETVLLLLLTLTLVLVGVVMVYSIGAIKAPSGRLFMSHLVYVALGLGVMWFVAHVDYHCLSARGVYRPLVAFSLALLVLVLVPGIGVNAYGAQRWLRLFTFQFQPSEFAKLTLILLLAVKLSENREHIQSFRRGFLPPLVTACFFVALILLERDLGMPVVLMAAAFAMIFVAGARWRHILVSGLLVVLMVFALSVTSPHRLERLRVYRHPWDFRDDETFQLVQSLTAFARGRTWGQGPGASEQKLAYLPAAETDFIFPVWAEETGLVGALLLLAVYVALIVVALRVASCARDRFGTLLAVGIVSLIACQSVFIMAVNIGLLPTKGLPLPFVSHGGTALIVFLALMGILLNIARQAQEPARGRPLGQAG